MMYFLTTFPFFLLCTNKFQLHDQFHLKSNTLIRMHTIYLYDYALKKFDK